MYESAFLSLKFRLNAGKNCACVTFAIVVYITRKKPFLTHVFLYSFSIAQAEFLCSYCVIVRVSVVLKRTVAGD